MYHRPRSSGIVDGPDQLIVIELGNLAILLQARHDCIHAHAESFGDDSRAPLELTPPWLPVLRIC